MSEQLKGRTQQQRRRKVVDTLNGAGVNLNLLPALNPGDRLYDPVGGGGTIGGTVYPNPVQDGGGDDATPANNPPNLSDGSCPNPGVASLTNMGESMTGNQLMQTFQVGAAVNPGFTYNLMFANIDSVSVQAGQGDTPQTIAGKLSMAVNEKNWNNVGNKPYAYATGDTLTTYCDYASIYFIASASGACQPGTQTPEPTPEPTPDPILPKPIIPKLPISEPAFPYSQFQIDAMNCQEVSDAINQMNSSPIWNSWKPMYDYMVARQATACAVPEPPPPPVNNHPSEPSFPYTQNQIDGMDCGTLQTTIVSVQQQINDHSYTTWNDMLTYMQQRSSVVCAVAPTPSEGEETPVPPMTPVPGVSTPQVIPFPIYSSLKPGGGGGGGSASGTKPVEEPKKKDYWWLAIALGAGIAYFTFGGGSES